MDQTYDPGQLAASPLMQTRFWIADTQHPYTFADGEVLFTLGNYDGDPLLAGADLLQALANDKARLAVVCSREGGDIDPSQLSDTYSRRAAELRAMVDVPGSIEHRHRYFTLGDRCCDAPGESSWRRGSMDIW